MDTYYTAKHALPHCTLFTVILVLVSSLHTMTAQVLPPCTDSSCLNGGVCSSTGCDCTGTGHSGTLCEIKLGTVNNCPPEAVAGLSWKPSPGEAASIARIARPCNEAYDNLKAGQIYRTCTNRVWSSPDYSECLITSNSAFVLLWVPLNVSTTMSEVTPAIPALEEELLRMIGLGPPYTLTFVRIIRIPGGPTPHVSVTFALPLSTVQPSPEIQATLSRSTAGFGDGVQTIGGLPVAMNAPWGVQGFYQADSCPCRQPTDSLFLGLCEEIVPVPACSPQGNDTFKCFFPYFLGDGNECTVDEDGDGFPNVPLEICSQLNSTNASYCITDNCPTIYNPTQKDTSCVTPEGFDGCLMEVDEVWEISWGNTLRGETDQQRCPQGPGFATRYCGFAGWQPVVASECGSYEFSQLEDQINTIFNENNLETRLNNSAVILQEVLGLTTPGPGRRVSRLPFDLDTTNRLIGKVLELLEEIQNGETEVNIPDFNVVDILSNVLTSTNLNGWKSLQTVAAGSRQLLDISERYGLYLSRTVRDDDNDRRLFQRNNLVIGFKNAVPDKDGDQVFPESEDDVNGTFTTIPAQITIPRAFLREQMKTNRTSVPVSTVLYRNMEQALPVGKNTTKVASMVISSQVSQRNVLNSSALQQEPIALKFQFDAIGDSRIAKYFCAFWQFSEPVGSGGWKRGGLSMMSQQFSSDGSIVTVTCNATHLTSFAVLVDLSGTLNPGDNNTGVGTNELVALQIVSYIGCAISLVCLLATIIFFLALGSELLRKVHYFIHLNLAITLFLAYLMFVVGIETARVNEGACIFVAAWLHYFFLSSFSWMLCEGIMLYLMLVLVFSKLSKRWWVFLLIGYGLPIVPVVVTVGARVSDYGVVDSNGTLVYCWLSTNNGVIWGFVGPMLAIIMLNLVFLVVALVTVFRSTRKSVKRKNTLKANSARTGSEKKTLFTKLFIATLVLLPLLGVTWILGLFTVNANTTLFAWLFTIFNSLQGLFIFFFHVLRSDKVWRSSKAIKARASLSRQFTSVNSYTSKRLHLKKTDTTTSIVLTSDVSSNGIYSVSVAGESSQVNIPPTISESIEVGVEAEENELPKEVRDAVSDTERHSEERQLNGGCSTESKDESADKNVVPTDSER